MQLSMNVFHVMLAIDRIYRSRWGRTIAAAMLVTASYAAGNAMNANATGQAKEPRYIGGATIVLVEPRANTARDGSAPFAIDVAPLGSAPSTPIVPSAQTISEL